MVNDTGILPWVEEYDTNKVLINALAGSNQCSWAIACSWVQFRNWEPFSPAVASVLLLILAADVYIS